MTRLLDRIDRPQDLHALSEDELQQVAQEVREHIIDTVGEIGGHFGANLGTCELTVALHSILDSPTDKILWDVGHQSYPHKILTGRRDQLPTIRQYEGLTPFCAIEESEHDIMGAGHASTSIGYAVGIKEAMRLKGDLDAGRVVAVIGDGSMTGGVAFESIHQAGGLGTPIVVVLNDNGMSISPNVGALSRSFNRMRLHRGGWKRREDIEHALTELPGGIGAAIEKVGPQLKESLKALVNHGAMWEELDWAYLGVIDGHDVKTLRKALNKAFAAGRPVVVHVATVKGKGFAPAEEGGQEGQETWHAAKPNSIIERAPAPKPSTPAAPAAPAYTDVFAQAIVDEVRRDPSIVGITAAMNSGTGLSKLQREIPDHYFDVGIAEQNALLFAAGLALEGVRPVAAIYSTFLQRGYDQIVHDLALQKLPVVLAMDRAGLVGDDGPTHHGVFDIAYLRSIPNMVLAAPRDEAELVHLLRTAVTFDGGPFGLRYPRGAGPGATLPTEAHVREVGRGEVLSQGDRVALVGYGTGVQLAIDAAAELEARTAVRPTVVDARVCKPLDGALLDDLAANHELLVTLEEGVLSGGFGSAVWEHFEQGGGRVPEILRVGLPDRYVTHGKVALLHAEVGFTPDRVARRVAGRLGLEVGAGTTVSGRS
ncbi:MAG: 1-deoxy-D-xylulose-5-phosphate synthase [Patulibacter sp.]|nr:1-deoxy-D-xylulose-5-phosphate synthase [Patulibacter sp.]